MLNRPVIESKEFYKLFPTLKRRLDLQTMTHNTAGEFLGTLKTLMAKLKVGDTLGSKKLSDIYFRRMTGEPSLVGQEYPFRVDWLLMAGYRDHGCPSCPAIDVLPVECHVYRIHRDRARARTTEGDENAIDTRTKQLTKVGRTLTQIFW